jgi:hypothetical protein
VDWGIGWHNVPYLHSCSTYDLLVVGLGQLGSSEHFDFQQLEPGDYWGAEPLDDAGWKILVQLLAALAKIAAELDRTHVQLKMSQHGA